MVVNVSHGVGGNGTGGSGTRSSDAGEAGISASKQTINRGFQVGEGEGQNAAQNTSLWRRRSGSPGHAVRSAISSEEGLVGERRTDDCEFKSVANIGDGLLDGLEKDLHALLLVLFVLLGSRRELLPRLVGLTSGGVHVNNVLSFGANGLVEQGGDEERAKILRVLHRSIPILHDKVGRVLEVGQIQTSGINTEEQMRNGTVTRQGAEIVPPLGQFLGLPLLLGHQLDSIERCGIGNDGLASRDDIAIFKSNANGTAILDEDLVNVSIELKLATELLQTTLKSLAELGGTTDWNGKGGRLLEKTLKDVKNMCRHGALGGETAEDAHAIDEVANKGDGDNFIHRLGQIIEGQGQIGEDVGVLDNEWESTSRRGEETSVLTKVQKSNGRGGSTESLETITKGVPLLDRLGSILSALLHEKLFKSLLGADGETPVSLGSPETKALVSFDGHGLLKDIEDHAKGVETGSVQSLKDTGPNLEAVLLPVVHAREGMCRSADLDVRFEAKDLGTVLGAEGRAGQTAHAGTDDDDVVLSGIAGKAVAGAGVGGLFVFGFHRHVVRERHDLLARRILSLSNIRVVSFSGGGGFAVGSLRLGG
mmetsp:Transcript_3883/g.10998  ORF Transcript_3883/g.10998 Transcript_3883/m.10998 type:complete len:593 (+) Transcript_3883:350-2128(+)